MPTKRKRISRGIGIPAETQAILGVGCGINHIPNSELKSIWNLYGRQVTALWRRKYGHDPFVLFIAKRGRWDEA